MLNRTDAIKFRSLQSRYDKRSNNVGILGDRERFDRCVKILENEYKDTDAKIIHNKEKNIFRILYKEQEICYILLETLTDLQGYYFRKYI